MANQDDDQTYEEQPQAHHAHGVGAHALPPMEARPDRRRIGSFDEPVERTLNLGIPTPMVANNNFELKTSLINMVQSTKFYGLPSENPLHHLDSFERLCRTVKINGVPQDAIKMILFPFSLGDRASQWENNIRSELVYTWPLVKKEFTRQFFPKQKTAKIRHDITTFKQGHDESFYEAWERMKGYTRSCPHHGVEMDALLGIFHGGVLDKFRIALDTASNGSFANLDVEQGERLIENLAQSDQCYSRDYDRSVRDSRPDDRRLKEINEKLDRLDKVLHLSQKHVHFVDQNEDNQGGYYEAAEEVNYLENQGGYQYKPAHPNLSYRSTNVENPYDQTYPPFQNQNQSFQARPGNQQGNQPYVPPMQRNFQQNQFNNAQGGSGYQNKGYNNFNNQGQSNGGNWNNKPTYFKGNTTNSTPQQDDDIRSMLKQLLQGQERHTKEICNLNAKHDGLATHVKSLENQIAQIASSSNSKGKDILPGKPEPNPREYCNVITLRSGKEVSEPEKPEKETITEEKNPEKEGSGSIRPEEIDPEKEKGKEAEKETKKEENLIPPPYEPKLPFPGRFKRQIMDEQYKKINELFEKLEVSLPLADLLKDSPVYNKVFKNILQKKRMVDEMMIDENHECSVIIQRNLPKKLRDPGSFTLPCNIGGSTFQRCLVDLGASVSLMPYTVSKRLGLTDFKKTRISLVLADRSVRYPIGLLEDIPVKVGDKVIPTDFIVLEMEEEPKDPIILGRPFLATSRAVINVNEGEIDLHLGDTTMKFDINGTEEKAVVEKKIFSVEDKEPLGKFEDTDQINPHPPGKKGIILPTQVKEEEPATWEPDTGKCKTPTRTMPCKAEKIFVEESPTHTDKRAKTRKSKVKLTDENGPRDKTGGISVIGESSHRPHLVQSAKEPANASLLSDPA